MGKFACVGRWAALLTIVAPFALLGSAACGDNYCPGSTDPFVTCTPCGTYAKALEACCVDLSGAFKSACDAEVADARADACESRTTEWVRTAGGDATYGCVDNGHSSFDLSGQNSTDTLSDVEKAATDACNCLKQVQSTN